VNIEKKWPHTENSTIVKQILTLLARSIGPPPFPWSLAWSESGGIWRWPIDSISSHVDYVQEVLDIQPTLIRLHSKAISLQEVSSLCTDGLTGKHAPDPRDSHAI